MFNQQYYSFIVPNLQIHCYQYYISRSISPLFIQWFYAVFSYKHFLSTKTYFQQLYTICNGHIIIQTATYYLRRPYTTFDGYILLLTAIYYFRWLYITFDGYILLLALPDWDFVKIQDFITISGIYGFKASLEFNISQT